MTQTQTKAVQAYQLPGNPVIPVPILGNLLYDERGEEAVAILNAAFRGRKGIKYTTKHKPRQPLTRSNTARNMFFHDLLREQFTSDNLRVQSPADMVRYWDILLEQDTTYADSNTIAIFPNPGPNENLRIEVLQALGRTATTVPLLVSGLKPVKVDTAEGWTLKRTDFTTVKEAPYLQKDGRVRYDSATQDLVAAKDNEDGVQIYVPNDQSGLRRAGRDGGNFLNFGVGGLLDSNAVGRVPLVQDPKGCAENLDALVESIHAERERQIAEVKSRHKNTNMK